MRAVFVWIVALAALVQPAAIAADKVKIDARTEEALLNFYQQVAGGEALARRAAGVLVFPRIVKAGLIFGGEYGEGKLLVDGETADYYSSAAGSFGLQIGAQSRTQILLFMTEEALASFRASDGWEVGVDGSVALVKVGTGAELDGITGQTPVIGFVLFRGGLMVNASLEGTKISKIVR